MSNIFDLFKKIEKQRETAGSTPITHLIVGLGNPGDKYFYTRHNAGFLAMDYVSQKCNASVNRSKFKALVGEATISGKRVLLMKPQTFMNLSGDAVYEAATFYKIPCENIIVMSDDVNLDVGRMRLSWGKTAQRRELFSCPFSDSPSYLFAGVSPSQFSIYPHSHRACDACRDHEL